MQQRFYSNGKLLITAEYLVLDGATALALPTRMGQDLTLEATQTNRIDWTSFDADGTIWLQTGWSYEQIRSGQCLTEEPARKRLLSILHEAHRMNPHWLENSGGFTVQTHLSFPRHWGLGTSSTLINNIAQWAQVDAYELLQKTFGGSGYDIACAQHNTPILYQRTQNGPAVQPVDFRPKCADQIYFVYLNQKQDSRKAIEVYRAQHPITAQEIALFNQWTQELLRQNDFESLQRILTQHEQCLSEILETKTVQKQLFPDFDGLVKSLGGWGGDFVLVLSQTNPKAYFAGKGYPTILSYAEMIA